MTLEEAINSYLQVVRAKGLLYVKASETYHAFLRTVGNLPLSEINTNRVLQFLNQPQASPAAFRRKHSLLRRFFDYWTARGAMAGVLMPFNRPGQRSTFLPYIYTREELRRLLRSAALIKRPNDEIHSKTLRAVLLTLYATGATVGEVTTLTKQDVDLRGGFIQFAGNIHKLGRRVPIGRDLMHAARKYAEWQKRTRAPSEFFFARINGKAIQPRTLRKYVERLRRKAGVDGYRASSRKPCLLDLRATFAVHRITAWMKKKEDLSRMLPALSAYMGNRGLESADRYLALTPLRFQNALNKLSPQKCRARWRNDPALLAFLTSL